MIKIVHPVPVSFSTILLSRSNVNAGRKNQKILIFIRGKAISEAIIGTSQFPNPAIIIGITIKKL